jgi:hypothetical protein
MEELWFIHALTPVYPRINSGFQDLTRKGKDANLALSWELF